MKNIEVEIIELYNKTNWSYTDVARKILEKYPNIGLNVETLRKKMPKILQGENVISQKNYDDSINADLIERRYKAKLNDKENKYKQLLKQYENLEKSYDDLLYIKENDNIVSSINPKFTQSLKDEAVAIIQYTDWHIEEVVESNKVNNLNKFNPDIASQRVDNLVNNSIKLIRKERHDINIDNLVLHLGGDFIGGWIHDELEQMNAMSPIEASIFAKNELIKAINFLLEHGDFEQITCICNRGNHSRTTAKMQHQNEMETNYETMIYSALQDYFKNEERVQFEIPGSGIGYIDIYDRTIRYFHGQQVKYLDGVGGIAIPLNKKLAKWDETIEADYNLMGHYHSWSFPNKKTTLNGSLKGFDTFAYNNGFSYERPIQSFQLLDKRKGVTIRCPIFCDC